MIEYVEQLQIKLTFKMSLNNHYYLLMNKLVLYKEKQFQNKGSFCKVEQMILLTQEIIMEDIVILMFIIKP
jgi:hypothetical protein